VLEELGAGDGGLLHLAKEVLVAEAAHLDLGLLGVLGDLGSGTVGGTALVGELGGEVVGGERALGVGTTVLHEAEVPVVSLAEVLLVDAADGRNALVSTRSGGSGGRTRSVDVTGDVLLAVDVITSVGVAEVTRLSNNLLNIAVIDRVRSIIHRLDGRRVKGDTTLAQRSRGSGAVLEHVGVHNTISHKREVIVGNFLLSTSRAAILFIVRLGSLTSGEILPNLTTLFERRVPHQIFYIQNIKEMNNIHMLTLSK
jgi:hypothetical protein